MLCLYLHSLYDVFTKNSNPKYLHQKNHFHYRNGIGAYAAYRGQLCGVCRLF